MTGRQRLPARRPSQTETVEHGNARFEVTIGFFPDDRVGEVFASGAKSGSELDGLLDDSAILISLLLQHGVEPAALGREAHAGRGMLLGGHATVAEDAALVGHSAAHRPTSATWPQVSQCAVWPRLANALAALCSAASTRSGGTSILKLAAPGSWPDLVI